MIDSVKYVVSEHIENRSRIIEIAKNHVKKQTKLTSLGIGWMYIKDFIYYSVFILFRFFMSGGRKIDGMPFILYLVLGLVPWFFINEVIGNGVTSIKSNSTLVKSIKFPVVTLPTIEVITIFFKRFFTLIVIFIVSGIFGETKNLNVIKFIYYFVSMFLFCLSYNMLVSSLIAVSRDFHQLYQAFTRILFFSIPIIWSFDHIEQYPYIIKMIKLNPITYIVMGFRESFTKGSSMNLGYTAYFWLSSLSFFLMGCYLQNRLKKYYSDFI